MERVFYDTVLQSLNDGLASYTWNGQIIQLLQSEPANYWRLRQVGKIGRLVINRDSGPAGFFQPYVEQRLRRAIECDGGSLWAWRLDGEGDKIIYANATIIPGFDGNIAQAKTFPLTLAIPVEFKDLCLSVGMKPEQILRGFIADAAGIDNFDSAPREDGYGSNGSEERMLARLYIERTHGRPCDE